MVDIYTLDFETYWDTEYTLSKMPIELYVRDSRFEAQCVCIKKNDLEVKKFWGKDVGPVMRELRPILRKAAVLGWHYQFDGFILSDRYGIKPMIALDGMSMDRAIIYSPDERSSLKYAACRYDLPPKGDEPYKTRGLRADQFTAAQRESMMEYCAHDVWLTWEIFKRIRRRFPKSELEILDLVLKMFTEPKLHLNPLLLYAEQQEIIQSKAKALELAGLDKETVMSNNKLAEALKELGVSPPTKISARTGKEAWAFAKTDEGFLALCEHPDPVVAAVVDARLQNKTTLAETRAEWFIRVAQSGGPWPVYLNYGKTQTHRLSGGNCLAEGTLIVVQSSGVVRRIPIEQLTNSDLVWDGQEFVTHDGLIDQGDQEVIEYGGLVATPDHEVYLDETTKIRISDAMQGGYTIMDCPEPEGG